METVDIDKDPLAKCIRDIHKNYTSTSFGLFSENPRKWIELSELARKISYENIQNEEKAKSLLPPLLTYFKKENISWESAVMPTKAYLNYLMDIDDDNISEADKLKIHRKFQNFLKSNPINSVLQLWLLSYNVSNYLERRVSIRRGNIKNNQTNFFKAWAMRFYLTKKSQSPSKCTKSWAAIQIKRLLEQDYPDEKIPSEKTIRENWLSKI
jgi:hypothetical protein